MLNILAVLTLTYQFQIMQVLILTMTHLHCSIVSKLLLNYLCVMHLQCDTTPCTMKHLV